MYSYIPSSGSHTCDLLCGLGSLGEQQEPDDHNVYLYLTAWSSTMRTYGRSTQFIRAFIVRVTPVYTVRTYVVYTGVVRSLYGRLLSVLRQYIRCVRTNVRFTDTPREKQQETLTTLKNSLPPTLQKVVELTSEKRASTWLTTLPTRAHGLSLHKQAFRDALCIRYEWDPQGLPSHCSCGAQFNITHAFKCHRGAFPTIRHNRIRDLTAQLLTKVCPSVEFEPHLQSQSRETFLCRTTNLDTMQD